MRYIIKQKHTIELPSGNLATQERYIINTTKFDKFEAVAKALIFQKRDRYYVVEIDRIETKITDIFNELYIYK